VIPENPDYDPATAYAPLLIFVYKTEGRFAGPDIRAVIRYYAFSPGHDGLQEWAGTSAAAADSLLRQLVNLGEHPVNALGYEIRKTTLKAYETEWLGMHREKVAEDSNLETMRDQFARAERIAETMTRKKWPIQKLAPTAGSDVLDPKS
jgi:hypothetical protein